MEGCHKIFFQKTHLDIHSRSHTGDKPFMCKAPGCNQRFSQLGNLKTHERRHTGERPYKCNLCGKTFAQRGNVNAHKIVHSQAKPFTCKLDNCNKTFTQLGNLKSHQNKFHAATIRRLKAKFDDPNTSFTEWELEMWQYFMNLYKNCNKGIKGRGKDRRISMTGPRHDDNTMSQPMDRRNSSMSSTSGSSGHIQSSPVMPFYQSSPSMDGSNMVAMPQTLHNPFNLSYNNQYFSNHMSAGIALQN